MSNKLYDEVMRSCWQPKSTESIKDWAENNINIGGWSRYVGGKLDMSLTPWIIEPLRALEDPDIYRVVVVGAAGGSKSTIAEIFTCNLVVNAPGDLLWAFPTEQMAKEFAEQRIHRFLESCGPVKKLFPTSPNKKRNTAIIFPHMSMFIVPANETNAQSKHVRYLIMDETWQYDVGMVSQFHHRTNSFTHNRKILELSTGPSDRIGDETALGFAAGTQKEYMVYCHNCQKHFIPLWSHVKWHPDHKLKSGEYDYKKIQETTALECPLCKYQHSADKVSGPKNFYLLNSKPQYSKGVSGDGGVESYHFNCIATKFTQLGDIAVRFVRANEARKMHNYSLLEDFVKKELAEQWEEHKFRSNRTVGHYVQDYCLNDPWECELKIMTVDVQESSIPFIIRGYNKTPESRLITYGNAKTFQEIRDMQVKYNVLPQWVWIDSGYQAEEVYKTCVTYDYTAVKGDLCKEGYTVELDMDDGTKYKTKAMVNDRNVVHPNVMPPNAIVSSCFLMHISEGLTQEIINDFKMGRSSWWSVPKDVGAEYLTQLNNVVKTQIRLKNNEFKWEFLKKKPHDYYDCERYNIAAAYYSRMLLTPPYVEEEKPVTA